MARRLAAALERRGCRTCVAHSAPQARRLFADEPPSALYLSEALERANGGDLLAELQEDERLARIPALMRVSRHDSVFARAMRHGGVRTIVSPVDVEATAATLASMDRGEGGL